MLSDSLSIKEKNMREHITFLGSAIVAYSGGVDSSLVAEVSHQVLGHNSLAILADSPSLSHFELMSARELACRRGFNLRIISTYELDDQRYVINDEKRCFYCKNELYGHLQKLFINNGYNSILDGANCDDTKDFRPGSKAAHHFGVISPLVLAGFSKDEVRTLAKSYGLPNYDKPASPCLSSRFLCGVSIDKKKLKQVEQAESFLRRHFFLKEFRVRHMGTYARIDVKKENHFFLQLYRPVIEKAFLQFGFSCLKFHDQGFFSGSLNQYHKK